ncbi:MAG: hypothetical protein AB8H80_11525 [Planctomycetota bacterium]
MLSPFGPNRSASLLSRLWRLARRSLLAFSIGSLGGELCAQRVAEASEPNSGTATATVLGCGQEAFGTLLSPADRDWYRFTLPAAANVSLETGPAFDPPVAEATELVLLDAAGAPLLASVDGGAALHAPGAAAGRYAALRSVPLAAGTYYCSVRPAVGAAVGGYLLDLRCRASNAASPAGTTNEASENNDPRTGGSPTSLIAPSRCSGVLSNAGAGSGGDWDFWRVLTFGPELLRVTLAATAAHPAGPAEDVVLYVFDGQSPPNRLAGPFHASAPGTHDVAIDVYVPGGFVQLAVRGNEGSAAGAYYLDVVPQLAATMTIHAGGCGGRRLDVPAVVAAGGTSLERARLGATYSIEGSQLDAGGLAFHVVGLQNLALDLTPFGAPGCTLEVDNVDAVFQPADANGRATWSVAVPDTTVLLGTRLESQAAVLDFSNPLGITISNRVTATIGG